MNEQTDNPLDRIPVEELEQAIVDIGAGMRKLNSSRLTGRAILVLIKDSTGVPMTTIKDVILGLETLESRYLKPKPKDKKEGK